MEGTGQLELSQKGRNPAGSKTKIIHKVIFFPSKVSLSIKKPKHELEAGTSSASSKQPSNDQEYDVGKMSGESGGVKNRTRLQVTNKPLLLVISPLFVFG